MFAQFSADLIWHSLYACAQMSASVYAMCSFPSAHPRISAEKGVLSRSRYCIASNIVLKYDFYMTHFAKAHQITVFFRNL